jgi:hypothetical protein
MTWVDDTLRVDYVTPPTGPTSGVPRFADGYIDSMLWLILLIVLIVLLVGGVGYRRRL